MFLSSGSDTEESESRSEMTEGIRIVRGELRALILNEGDPLSSPATKRNASLSIQDTFDSLIADAKQLGYSQAESLYINHVRYLEELLEKERKERRRLEEERTRLGEEVRKIVRRELKKAELDGKKERADWKSGLGNPI